MNQTNRWTVPWEIELSMNAQGLIFNIAGKAGIMVCALLAERLSGWSCKGVSWRQSYAWLRLKPLRDEEGERY